MKRFSLEKMQHWHRSPRRKPLVLRGARQVGKSTRVRLFAREHGLDLIEINCERHRELDAIFRTLDLENILKNLQSTVGKISRPPAFCFWTRFRPLPTA